VALFLDTRQAAVGGALANTVHYGRQDFAGWTGLGPVALLIEQAIGLDIIGAEHRVLWHLREPGRVGLQSFALGKATVSLVAEPELDGHRSIAITSTAPFTLEVVRGKAHDKVEVRAASSTIKL